MNDAATDQLEAPQRDGHSMSVRQYISLVRTLAASEFKLRFADSILGYFWTLSKPLMLFGVMYVVFSHMLRFGAGIEHYTVILLMAIMFWGYFSEATSSAVNILVARADLIRKAWFPRSALAVSVVATAFLIFLTNMVALAVFVAINGISPRIEWLLFLPLILELTLLTVGMSLLLSGLYVFVRDIGQLWAVISQALFYATPIIYPLEMVQAQGMSETLQRVLLVNPIAQIIQDARAALIGANTQSAADVLGPFFLAPYLIVALLLVVGGVVYVRLANRLAEYV